MIVLCFCLCLLWTLVDSQTVPYVSFRGETLPNHGYVDLSLVGDAEDGSDSVQCHTNLTTCCTSGIANSDERPDWYFPDGDELRFKSESGAIYHLREAQRIDLRHRNNALSPSGIYRCEIPTDYGNGDFVRETVYVGIYGSGGTFNSITCTAVPEASPQFTLTCISTGGPTTTVTWTRDSVTVTEGTETVLDNPVTAQYTHTLTVTENQSPALFICAISNSYSSINTQILIIEGVQMLVVVSLSSRTSINAGGSVTLTCTVSNSMYSIQWEGPGVTPTPADPTTSGGMVSSDVILSEIATSQAGLYTCTATLSDSTISTSINITVQIPAPTLVITVSTTDRTAGTALSLTCDYILSPSVNTTVETEVTWMVGNEAVTNSADDHISIAEASLIFSPLTTSDTGIYTCTLTITTPQTPHVTVQGPVESGEEVITVQNMPALSVNLLSPTSLTISWTLEDNSVTATSYNISYSNIDTDCFTMTYEDITSSEMTVELTGLEEGTEYSITITAILNDVVVGRDDLMGTTMTAISSAAPDSVSISEVTSSGITVQWEMVPCIHHNGDITGYSVRYGIQGESTQTMSAPGDSSGGSYEITGLQSSTTYSIEVAAINSAGTGEYSEHKDQLTSVEAPSITVAETSVTSTSIPLTWTSAGSEAVSYEVEWTYDGQCAGISGGRASVGVGMTSYTIEDLEEAVTYSITVTATNAMSSAVSLAANGMTRGAVPSGSPTVVSATTSTSTTITVHWEPVDCIDSNGVLTGYSVQYKVVESGTGGTMSVTDGSALQLRIKGLSTTTDYSVSVAAVNSAGTGVYSDPYLITTESAISVVDISATVTSISLQWSVIAGIQPSGYTISYSNTDNTDCFTISDTVSITDGSDMDYVIEDLEEGTEYTITVTLLRDDEATDEDTEKQATADATPSAAPTSVSVLPNVTSSSITVQWEMVPCINRNGDIAGYLVQYEQVGSGSPHTLTVSEGGILTTIQSVMSSTNYSIQVAAENSAGTGPYSDRIVVETQRSVYLSLRGDIIPNHGYVVISDIGSTDSTALICHTNRPVPDGSTNSGGNWFGPNRTRVFQDDVPGFVRNRGPMVVRLLRNTATAPPAEGIYHCEIEDDMFKKQTVYVGLYDSGGGNITNSDKIVFALNSDISKDSPQFTLTCISTGGPATTVTWTRDSVTVTEGTETMLVNGTTAVFNHTLTVTERLGGLYVCSVSNKVSPKESTAELNINVASPPSDITVTTTLSTVMVSWPAPNSVDVVTGYLVYSSHPDYNMTFNTTENSYIISENSSQRVYTVSVQALSEHLPSAIVGPVTVRVPGPVEELTVDVVHQSLNISWEKPTEPNDYTWNYTITVTTGTNTLPTLHTLSNETQITVVTKIEKGVPHTVVVFATNGRGNSADESTLFYSEEDVPGAPKDVEVKRVDETHMRVSWSALTPVEARGYISHYTVFYWPASDSHLIMTTTTAHNVTSVVIGDLVAGETYTVQVSATTGAGSGERSSETTLSPVPDETSVGEETAVVAPVVGVIVGVLLVAIVIIFIIILIRRRRRRRRGSVKMKTKPLPPPKKPKKRERSGEKEKEVLEMEGLVATTEEEKDYYFEDPSNIVTGRNDIPEAEFPEHVKQMHQDRDQKLELEYKSLEKISKPASEAGRLSSNLPHNRFKNIYPYDDTRVVLNGDPDIEGSDYINASFIDGYPDRHQAYIASQGPTEQTVGRFWQMVWEQQLPTIVMLTCCVEDGKEKCEQYWPDQMNTTVTMGSKYNVTLTSFVPSAEYQIRKLTLKPTSEPGREMTVTHMNYTAWPDHAVPHNAMSLIAFIHRVRKEHPVCLDQPLLVHCSAGVGRTGTFILLDTVMHQMKREGTLSVYNHLRNMRTQRMKLVQTQAQYVFIHDSLSELVVCGETEIAAADVRIVMSQMKRRVAGDNITGFQKQFQTLEKVSSQYQASYLEAKALYNVNKNRFSDKLPNELGRVRLQHGAVPGSDYINASFVDGYKHRRAYIATQGPLPDTVSDFWRMVWEHRCSCIVMLCATEEEGKESSQIFWPQGSEGAADVEAAEMYGKMRVTLRRVSGHGDIIEQRLEVEEEGGNGTHRVVTLLQLSGWTLQELPHTSAILSLIDLLSKAQRSTPSKHTIIMCSDGVGRTGTFICLHSQLERLKTEGVVDFFQAVKSARIQRAGLLPDATHYAFCHEVVASYLDSFETYANFKEVV